MRELEASLRSGDILVQFQPQVDIRSNRTVAVEALCRWLHPDLGLLLPYAFIPLAEESGLIGRLGDLMVTESIAAARRWQELGTPVGIAINVSPTQLAIPDFGAGLLDALATADLDPWNVTLEITETEPIEDLAASMSTLAPLRHAGVVVAIDDYGAGHSSLSRLDDLGAGELKIDRSLLQNDSATTTRHLADVVVYAHERSIRVVAEGIERPEHLDRARDLGCDRAQGFLLGRPMSQREITSRLASEKV